MPVSTRRKPARTAAKSAKRKPSRRESILETHFDKEGFCKFLGVDQRTADRWQASRYGPPRSRIGSRVYYDKRVVMEWIKQREVGGSAAA